MVDKITQLEMHVARLNCLNTFIQLEPQEIRVEFECFGRMELIDLSKDKKRLSRLPQSIRV